MYAMYPDEFPPDGGESAGDDPEGSEGLDPEEAVGLKRRAFLAAGGGLAAPFFGGCVGGDGDPTATPSASPPPTTAPTGGETVTGTGPSSGSGTTTVTDAGTADPGEDTPPDRLWQLGEPSGGPAAFGDRTEAADAIAVPADWADREDWSAVPRGLSRETNPSLAIEYELDSVPEGGATFSARITNAHGCAVPQMGVLSNGVMVGNVQIAGLDGVDVTEEIDFRTTAAADASAPLRVGIEREDDRITGSYSPDGETWTELESLEMDMAGEVYVGIAAYSPAGDGGDVELDGLDGEGIETWGSRGIGGVEDDGSLSYGDGSVTVAAPPGDLDGEEDAFRYLYRELDGDGELVARVVGDGGSNAVAAGVVIRERLEADSPTAATVLDGEGEVEFRWRPVLPDLPEVQYTDTYEVYVPPEFLRAGTNTLELRAPRELYTDEAVDPAIYWEWETLALESLSDRLDEPIHGRHVRMGTTFDSGGTTGAGRDPEAVIDHLEPLIEWLGIAYSGNTLRMGEFGFPRAYLETLRELNTSVCTLHVPNYTGSDPEELEDGELRDEHAPHLKIVAPGWFYTGYDDYPTGWAADPEQRRRVERHCDLTNGHAYGLEYCDGRGANLVENVLTFQGTGDRGLPKPMMATEMGTNDWHTDHDAFASTQPHASIFDRICRAHVGFADQFMQHAAFFEDGFGLFEAPETFTGPDAPPPEETTVYPGVDGEDPRVKTYRRLALAYATHGAPLPYSYDNRAEVEGRRVYVRAVDTSTLADLPTGGQSETVLVNLVNFEAEPAEVDVTVTMPETKTYEGKRYGEVRTGTTYADAHTAVSVESDPTIGLSADLGPGQAVQYVLE
jgi:hypothetical protein